MSLMLYNEKVNMQLKNNPDNGSCYFERIVVPKTEEAEEKLEQLTNPDSPMPTIMGGNCSLCGCIENYIYHVPENIWRKVIPKGKWNEIVCACCFHKLAKESNF